MKSTVKFLFLFFITSILVSCVDDVNSTPPRTVRVNFDWSAANLAGLDSAVLRVSHQSAAAELIVKPGQEGINFNEVIGNLVIHETPDPEIINTPSIGVVDQTYIVPIEEDSVTVLFITPEVK
ncbi:hypothetical protein [Flammeovirga sp. SubArs3]|uniref:hypothetical protein n=1 Tax=Flammeovirga sp. SubArs3 TaxID=2995316 RepID=UPI00248B3F8B|nr:hypothetical protein [Flammeovirga sp. SubArs3]